MPGVLQLVTVSKTPQRIQTLLVTNDTFMLVNPDITNNIFIGNDPASQLIAVPALGSVTLSATKHDVWVSTNGGNYTVAAYLMPNGSNWVPSPAQVAAQINALGLAKDTTVQATNTALGTSNTNTGNTATNTNNTATNTANNVTATQNLGGAAGRSVASDMLSANKAVTREISALIASGNAGGSPGGVPLLRFTNQLGTATSQTLAANGQINLFSLAGINQPGYEMMFQCSIPAGVGTNPFCSIILNWFDSLTGLNIKSTFFVPALGNGPGNAILYYMYGPCYGDALTVQLTNLEPAQTMTYTYVMNQTSHVHITDKIIQPVYPSTGPVTFGIPGGTPGLGILCITSPSIGASGTIDRLLAVWSGKAFIDVDDAGQAGNCNVQLCDPTGNLYSNLNQIEGSLQIVVAGQTYTQEIALPNGPMLLRMHNASSTTSIKPTVIITTKDY